MTEGQPRLRRGPKAGDRLPDARVRRGGRTTYLQEELCQPHMHLLLCGPIDEWRKEQLEVLAHRFADLIKITRLTSDGPNDVLVDSYGEAMERLGAARAAQYVVRPDGHIAFRCAGTDLGGTVEYLSRWFEPAR